MTSPRTISRRDLEFHLFEWLRVQDLSTRPRFGAHSRQTYEDVLRLSETMAVDLFLPSFKASDDHEPTIDDEGRAVVHPTVRSAVRAYMDSGMQGGTFDTAHGGMQLPASVHQASALFFQAACAGSFGYPMLASAAAALIVAHGTEQQVHRYAAPILDGQWFGTMCLSEPDVGSSLADVRTKAELADDGSWRVFGTKMWISAGDHEIGANIVHLVLAKTPGSPAGAKGLSLFIVPKVLPQTDTTDAARNDVTLVGLNHKMGFRATTNTLLSFGDGAHSPGGRVGAVGELIGQEGSGLAIMFHMMNEARTSVGAGAAAIGYRGYLHALDFARERAQGRPLGTKNPSLPAVTIDTHPDVRRMLVAQKSYVEGATALVLYCSHLLDECRSTDDATVREEAALLLDSLTPIAKSWPSQWCLAANDLAIQVHGGAGYTRDHAVEQLYRDNRLNMIHEGTNGIQALDLLGRRLIMNDWAGLSLLVARIVRTARTASAEDSLKQAADTLEGLAVRFEAVTKQLWASGDPTVAMTNASLHLDAAGHLVIAWLWLDQLTSITEQEGGFYDGKRAAAQYFFDFELPFAATRLDLLETNSPLLADLDPDVL